MMMMMMMIMMIIMMMISDGIIKHLMQSVVWVNIFFHDECLVRDNV